MKIKTNKTSLLNTKLIVPVDGLVSIDKNGELEVSDKCANILLNYPNDWISDEGIAKVEEQVPDLTEEKVVAGIKNMSLSEMIALAKTCDYPEEEWKKFQKNGKLFGAYLIKKFNSNPAVTEETESTNEA